MIGRCIVDLACILAPEPKVLMLDELSGRGAGPPAVIASYLGTDDTAINRSGAKV